MKKGKRVLSIALPILSVCLIAVLWGVAAFFTDDGLVIPKISETFFALFELLKSADFYGALFSTLLRSLVAFTVSYALAFLTALLSYKSENAKKFLSPLITIVRTLPTVAVVLLLVLWTDSKIAPIVVTTLVVFPMMHGELSVALFGIDKDALTMCRVYGVSKKDRFFKVILSGIAPHMILSVGTGFTLNLKLMVAAEVLASTARSLGYLLNTSKIYFETATMTAIVLVTLLIGLLVDGVFTILSKKAGKYL